MNAKTYILRSMLFVPGNRPDLIRKAINSKADALILDLEDSVVESEKLYAREEIKKLLKTDIFKNKQIFIRLNDIDSGLLGQELDELTHEFILGFLYPKVFESEEIIHFDELLQHYEKKGEFAERKFKIIPLIETTAAVMNIQKICSSSPRIIAVALGSEDYLSDLRGLHHDEEYALLFPRSMIANAARATGIIPIDTLNIDVHNLDKLEKKLKLTRILGFEGSLLLHPKEIELTNRYYTPSLEEIERAEKIVTLSEEIYNGNRSIAVIDGNFIGPPLVRSAKKLLDRYELIRQIGKK